MFNPDTVVKTSESELVVLRQEHGEFKVTFLDLDSGDWRDIRDEFDAWNRRQANCAFQRQEAIVQAFYL